MINTLAALLVALTLGTVALMIMETSPVIPEVKSLIATPATNSPVAVMVRETYASIPTGQWKNIVIHSAVSDTESLAKNCHFIVRPTADIYGMRVSATNLWKHQRRAAPISGPNASLNNNSIAICILGDFNTDEPSSKQFLALVSLARSLQHRFNISLGHVYLRSDLEAGTTSPGTAFPAGRFYGIMQSIR